MYQKEGKRKANHTILDWVVSERDGACLAVFTGKPLPACWGGLDPHHIVPRSANGKDVPENIITLCRGHHDMAEANLLSKEELRQVLTTLYGYRY